jgi:hypothetical protein
MQKPVPSTPSLGIYFGAILSLSCLPLIESDTLELGYKVAEHNCRPRECPNARKAHRAGILAPLG